MRSILSFALLVTTAFSQQQEQKEEKSCAEIEKGFREEYNAHKQPVCICADKGIFSTIQGFAVECESASITSVSENLQSLNGTVLGRLTIRDSTINVLPNDIFDNVFTKQLKLERCSLASLQKTSFGSLGQSLESLSLRENRIKKLEKGVFSLLPKMTTLDLGQNKIQELEPGTFDGLKNVREILLNGNEISELKAGTFDGLKRLKKLTLEACGIEKIEKGTFRGLDSLEHLIISNNKLENIDWSIFSSLKNLRLLDLGSNKLSSVELKSFPKLEKLVLNNNSIDSMKSIKLKDLPSLVIVMIDRNQISSLGDMDMYGLTRSDKIETLSFAWNNLSSVGAKAFQHTPNLLTLLLQNNRLEELSTSNSVQPRTPFLSILKKLTTLQLSSNNLSTIRVDELPKSLINLALDHNVITKIEARALEGMAIKRLYLNSNRLNHLYRGSFDSIAPTSMEAVDLSMNAWVCVCADPKEWLPRWLAEADEADVAEGPVGCLAIPECGQPKDPNSPSKPDEETAPAGWITVAATVLTVITIVIMLTIVALYVRDNRHQFPLRGRRSDSDLHKLIDNDPLNIASDSILIVPPMPKRKTGGPKKTVRFENF